MRKSFPFLFIGLVFSSCATLMSQRSVDIRVQAETDPVKICVNRDTSRWFETPAWINVVRSRDDLILTARRDTSQKQIVVKSRLSSVFWLGNLFYGGLAGFAIDLTNPKRYTFPAKITINEETGSYKRWLNPERHLLNFKISVPEGNYFYLNKGYKYGNSFGFLGISGGFEYYLTNKYCLNMDIGGMTDFLIPFPVPIDYYGDYHNSSAIYGDIQIGTDVKRWHCDVGLQYNRTFYNEWRTFPFPDYSYYTALSKNQNNVGLAFSTYYRITNTFNLGVNYYPSFWGWDNKCFRTQYSHLLFFELLFRIEGFRPGK